jgi:hypothetical protein
VFVNNKGKIALDNKLRATEPSGKYVTQWDAQTESLLECVVFTRLSFPSATVRVNLKKNTSLHKVVV